MDIIMKEEELIFYLFFKKFIFITYRVSFIIGRLFYYPLYNLKINYEIIKFEFHLF